MHWVDELLHELTSRFEGCFEVGRHMERKGAEERLMSVESSVVLSGITYTHCLHLTLKEEGLGPDVC